MVKPMPERTTLKGVCTRLETNGFGRIGGIELPYCLPGEMVQYTEVSFKRKINAYLDTILEPSPERQVPPCIHFGNCGGCLLQQGNQNFYRNFKLRLIKTFLERENVFCPRISEGLWVEKGQRRRANLDGIKKEETVQLGFHRLKSQNIIDIPFCQVLYPDIVSLFPSLKGMLHEILHPFEKCRLFFLNTDQGVDVGFELLKRKTLTEPEERILTTWAQEAGVVRLQFRAARELIVLFKKAEPTLSFGAVAVPVDPWCFVQSTQESQAFMIEKIVEFFTRGGPFVDLFAGRGTFTFPLVPYGAVWAYESDKNAQKALKSCGVKGVESEIRDLFQKPLSPQELNRFKGAILNPPRSGAQKQAEALAQSTIPKIAYISCSPESFARDARILVEGGYQLEILDPVDQFLWTAHMEVIGFFTRHSVL